MKLVELEIARHNWASMACHCGRSAEHVGSALLRLAHVQSHDDATAGDLEGHVHVEEILYEPAVATVLVALTALADDVSDPARLRFVDLLATCTTGESPMRTIRGVRRDLPQSPSRLRGRVSGRCVPKFFVVSRAQRGLRATRS